MSDEIDREVTRLFRDMERELGLANVSDVPIAHALQEIGVAHARARERVQSVVALLKLHYDTLRIFRSIRKSWQRWPEWT